MFSTLIEWIRNPLQAIREKRKSSKLNALLINIIQSADEVATGKLWRELLDLGPSNQFLCWMIRRLPKLQKRIAKQLFASYPTRGDLWHIAKYVSELRLNAIQIILSSYPSKACLRRMIVEVPEYQLRAALKLLKSNPGPDDLRIINRWVPELQDEVEERQGYFEENAGRASVSKL